MKKNNLILSAALAAVFSTSAVFAEAEVTGKFTYERANYNVSGSTIGDRGNASATGTYNTTTPIADAYRGVTTLATPSHNSEAFKSEAKAQIFVDGDVNADATYHVELQGFSDNEATNNHDSNESYTQRDALREAYVDTTLEDWSIRAGKQQIVWGTADGMKLLDTINPTDYSEMAQNQMEDSRITTWMLNAEKDLEDGSSVQVVVSQPKENVFAGLNREIDTGVRANASFLDDTTLNNGTDTGHAFMMMGPDTITGAYNGFLNIVPDLGSVASQFGSAFTPTSVSTLGAGLATELLITNATTGAYTIGTVDSAALTEAELLAFNTSMGAGGFGNLAAANMNGFIVGTKASAAGTTFASMDMTTMDTALNSGVATSNDKLSAIPPGFRKAIAGLWQNLGGTASAVSAKVGYTVVDMGDIMGYTMLDMGFGGLYSANLSSFGDGKADSAFEYMNNTTFRTFDAFSNAKSQYVYNMPSDSDVDVAARFKGVKDGVNYSINTSYNYDKNPIIDLSWRGTTGQKLTTKETYHNMATGAGVAKGTANASTTLQLYDAANTTASNAATAAGLDTVDAATAGFYGGANASAGRFATLQFSQEVKRVKQLGGSFDTAIETASLGPVVIRGEALYTKDGFSPIMSKTKLAYGDLVGALQMKKADRFKYVLGADVTALTNMMISAQFIQDRNLDFVDDASGYTADYSTMHLSNGFKKAEKNKNFYSLFFSKPFGASGEHRWNNITMLEKSTGGNGKWNRLDAEFSIDDDTQATVEYNKYWGGANSQFGQLEKTSNIQAGIKYSF